MTIANDGRNITRTQTGVRIEAKLLKVLKALAELHDLSLGDLLEGIALHALDGKLPFSKSTMEQAVTLRQVYGLTLTSEDSHKLVETRGKTK
jgi:hypothetical protein